MITVEEAPSTNKRTNRPSTKKLGVIVGVDGTEATVGMYDLSNDANYLWYGTILTGPKVGAYLTINQNDVRIIAKVTKEKVIDQQNTVRSTEFDNRYTKNSINRVVTLKVQGVIEDQQFQITSVYVPMIGNEVVLTSAEDLGIIYSNYPGEDTIDIGESLLENQPIRLPVDRFFARHIGIFGNTGSGKSNTLHKLYLELFRSKFYDQILSRSQFFIIDFNGEYTGDGMFGVEGEDNKRIFDINTRSKAPTDKISVTQDYLFDADILGILFNATRATQIPFLKNSLKEFKEEISDKEGISDGANFADLEIRLLISIIKGYKNVPGDSLDNWIKAAEVVGTDHDLFDGLTHNFTTLYYGNLLVESPTSGKKIVENGQITPAGEKELKLDSLRQSLTQSYNSSNPIRQLRLFLEFQRVYVAAWRSTNIEFINPLFRRIESAFDSLSKVVEIKQCVDDSYKAFNIFNLVHANTEIRQLVPMLLSKMFYDLHKNTVSGKEVDQTKHLVIDEAHNILNAQDRSSGDSWQDYRLGVFEEIIKEGRKFGFFLTLSSQRPADISPTIMSQLHNFIIHRLVNDKDISMLTNTMPTLDRASFQMIPSLGKGEAIITGTAIQVPIFVKVPLEETIHPNSDDIELTKKIWSENNTSDSDEEFGFE